jgi:prepilin-type N-terminal cleavage/methylation domain-containing protein
MNRGERGFTLIELLVVVAIIALLMAILVPVLGKAKKQAQATTCLSGLKQIGVAAHLYAQDNDWSVPRGSTGSSAIWFMQFLPYVGQRRDQSDYRSVKIYRCKSFPRTGTGLYDLPNSRQTVCYVINDWTFSSRTDETGTSVGKPTKLSRGRRRRSIWPTTRPATGVPSSRAPAAGTSSAATSSCARICRSRTTMISTTASASRGSGTAKAAMPCSSTGTPSTSVRRV